MNKNSTYRKPKFDKVIDAERPITVCACQRHWNKAIPFDHNNCVIALAGRERYKDCRMLRNYCYFQRKDGVWLRTYAGPAARVIAALLDKGNKKNLNLPLEGVRLTFDPPVGVRSIHYLRSPRRKAYIKKWNAEYAKNKKNKKGKGTYRGTDTFTLEDIRNGRGLFAS